MMELFDLTIDQLSFGFKATWTIVALIVAYLFAKTRHGCVSVKSYRLMTGVVWISLSCVAAQSYWAIWRFLRALGYSDAGKWFVSHGHFEAFVLVGIALGYSYHLGHLLEPKIGRFWLPISLGVIGVMFWVLANLPKLFI